MLTIKFRFSKVHTYEISPDISLEDTTMTYIHLKLGMKALLEGSIVYQDQIKTLLELYKTTPYEIIVESRPQVVNEETRSAEKKMQKEVFNFIRGLGYRRKSHLAPFTAIPDTQQYIAV